LLFAGPAELLAHVPEWAPVFWHLRDHSPEELLEAEGEWLRALAVVRAERSAPEQFQEVFRQVLARMEALARQDHVRWDELAKFVTDWAIRRRSRAERGPLFERAVRAVRSRKLRQEVREMVETEIITYEQELQAELEAELACRRAELEAELARRSVERETEAALRARREALRTFLEERFGALPAAVVARIETCEDADHLRAAIRRAPHLPDLEALEL
jgi:hypothetical protein